MRKQQPLDGDGDDQECAPAFIGRDLGAKLDEEEEEYDDDVDCFFESLDRVPSGVSFDFDVPSSSSDGDDDDEDTRFSFASAVAPPSDFGRLSISISDLDDEEHNGSHGFDYGIWMAEPISIQERRRLLFQGLGFTSSKEIPVPPPTSSPSAATEAVAAPEVRGIGARSRRRLSLKFSKSRLSRRIESHPSSSPSQPTLARSRSDGLIVPRGSEALLRRCSSAPSSLSNRVRVREGISPEGGESLDFPADGGVCRIKNLDTGKEFVVSEVKKDGTWGRLNDLQTGLQLTLEEFERFLGYSPIVKELMCRVKLGGGPGNGNEKGKDALGGLKSLKSSGGKRKGGGWLKNIKFVASSVTGLISERDREWGPNSSMRRSSSSRGGSEWLKVHQHGKSYKELTGLYMCQQIQAHQGAIWCIKFSSDSQYLASAGEDRVVHVWQVVESDVSSALVHQGSLSSLPPLPNFNGAPNRSARLSASPSKRTRKGKVSSRSSVPEYIVMPEAVFMLAEKPVCSFEGHLDDILDLSWSKSQYLLSSSMDKTVRLWDMESKSCLKLFAHNDYVTCIQFNPVDDMYFISGSLDGKVRIWSIRDRQVVDWSDLHEMVTAVSYTPDGQGALVGSHKGSCRFYKKTDCKLDQKSQVDIWSKKRKSHAKKITGFQFAPDNPFEVLITSADSQIRVFEGVDMIHKFRGFRNTSSQISASYTSDGRFVVCASEDSHVYVWKRDTGGGGKSKGLVTTRSHEHFYCKDVSVAIPWTCSGSNCSPQRLNRHHQNQQLSDSQRSNSTTTLEELFPSSRTHCPLPLPKKNSADNSTEQQQHRSSSSLVSSSSSQRSDASGASSSSSSSWGWYNGGSSRTSSPEPANALGLVVVTGGLGGEIKIYQNFGLPLRLSRQTNLF